MVVRTTCFAVVQVLCRTVATRGVMARRHLNRHGRTTWAIQMHRATPLMGVRNGAFGAIVSFFADPGTTGRGGPQSGTKTTGGARPCTGTRAALRAPMATITGPGTTCVLHVVIGTVPTRGASTAHVGINDSTRTATPRHIVVFSVGAGWAGCGGKGHGKRTALWPSRVGRVVRRWI
jgi:hypothetical protein